MTLVASFRFNDGFPYLIGDALISGSVDSSILNLPTNSNMVIERDYDGILVPTGLKQKTIVLSDHLAIGWADTWIECAPLIREIKEEFSNVEVSGSDVVNFLKGKEKEYPNANLIGISKKGDMHHTFFFNGALKCSHHQLEDYYAIGTGAKYFADLSRDNTFAINGNVTENVCSVVGLFGGMLGNEMVEQSTILNNFGGAFELVHFYNDNTFKKLEHMTYYFWSANQLKDGKVYVTGLPIILKYVHDGSGSVVIRVTGNRADCKFEGMIPEYKKEIFRLNPVIGIVPDNQWQKLEKADLNSHLQCHYIFGRKSNGQTSARSLSVFSDNFCKIRETGSDLVITETANAVEIISKEVIEWFSS